MVEPKQKKYDIINEMLDGDIIFEDTREPSATVKLITLISKIIVVVVISGLFCFYAVLFFTGGCKIIKELEMHEDGYFQYIIMGNPSRYPFPNERGEAVVAIVGLTESGKEQEAIDIPREIDGMPVLRVGYTDDVCHNEYYIESENLKKFYVHDNIVHITNFEVKSVDLMICSLNENFGISTSYHKKYFYRAMLDDMSEEKRKGYYPANIVFMNNHSEEINGGYYWLDNISMGEKIPLPPNPEREGYAFGGWYTEPECINKWDFDMTLNLEKNEEFRLYAGWQTTN